LELALTEEPVPSRGDDRALTLVAVVFAQPNMVERFLAMLRTGRFARTDLASDPAGLYAIAWLRCLRGRGRRVGFLLLLGLVDEHTVDRRLTDPDVFSLEEIAVLQIASGLWSNRSWRMIAGIVTALPRLHPRRRHLFTAANGFYPLHPVLLVLFVTIFDDATAERSAALWPIVPLALLFWRRVIRLAVSQVPVVVQLAYIAMLTVGSGFCWHPDG
jgi:hypothetical protein